MSTVPFTREPAATHVADMIAHFLGVEPTTAGRVTDFNAGSNILIFLEAVGVRLENLDTKVFLALRRAIPAMLFDFFGEGDGIATTIGFPAIVALPASGLVRFVRTIGSTGDITIPPNTRFQVQSTVLAQPPREYSTTLAVTIPDGSSQAEGLVRAVESGPSGNTPANTVLLVTPITNVDSATNPAAFVNGADAEGDEPHRQRFAAWWRSLARAQHAGLEVGALRAKLVTDGVVTEQVLQARSVPVAQKRGLVDVWVDNGGGAASTALVAAAQTLIDGTRDTDGTRVPGYKAAGVQVTVKAVTAQVVAVTLAIEVEPGFVFTTVEAAVDTAITAYVVSLGVFTDLILADLIATVVLVRGVRDVTITSPTANVIAEAGKRISPGVITVTETV
jgi:uncharacterized phage protein gp47/JayE